MGGFAQSDFSSAAFLRDFLDVTLFVTGRQ